MNEKMMFPNTLDEFIEEYSFIDDKEFYTNGSKLIPTFRVKQWEEHKNQEKQDLIKYLEDKIQELTEIIREDNINRISTTYNETKREAYQEILDKIKEDNYE